jgi:hypothetical protein
MGTRSLTCINDERGREIVVMYRQFDGYPTGHGQDLKEFLEPFTIVNGLRVEENRKVANGMDCLAAQLVAHFKTTPGDIYLMPAKTRDAGEEYIYTVHMKDHELCLKVQAGAVTFFGLPGTTQEHMPTIFDGPVATFDGKTVEAGKPEEIVNDYVNGLEDKAAKPKAATPKARAKTAKSKNVKGA